MITDINSLISNQGRTPLASSTTSSIGTLSKLSSELKLIEGIHPIQITSVKNSQSGQQSTQLIGITQSDKQLTLLNSTPSSSFKAGDKGSLVIEGNKATLTVQSSPQSQLTSSGVTPTQPPIPRSSANVYQSNSPQPPNTAQTGPQASPQQQAKFSAEVAIASRPITLTVISTPQQSHSLPTAPAARESFSATVSDGQNSFILNTKHPLKLGESVQVMVDRKGQLQLYPSAPAQTREAVITDALKQSLPKQISSQEFTGMLRQLSALQQSGAVLPEKVSAALDQLVRQLPNLQTLTQSPEALKQAIQTSGLFSESNLANSNLLAKDVKLNLTRLDGAASEAKSSVQPTLPAAQQQALNMVAGAVEHITTNQLRNIVETAQQDGQTLPLNIALPIKDQRGTSMVNIRIDKDGPEHENDAQKHERRWLVQLKFEFEETGRFEARMSVQGQKVGIIFAVEAPETEQQIKANLQELKDNLRQKNVEIETLECFITKFNETTKRDVADQPQRLIDVRT